MKSVKHIEYCDLSQISDEVFYRELSKIPKDIHQLILRYRFMKDRKQRLFGKLIVKRFYTERNIPFSWDDWRITKGGKPFLLNGIEFNISHSENSVIVAFSNFPVGIDFEFMTPISTEFISNYLCEEENKFLNESSNKLIALYHIWTRKEALLKCKGTGIVSGLDQNSLLQNYHIENLPYVLSTHQLTDYMVSICIYSESHENIQFKEYLVEKTR